MSATEHLVPDGYKQTEVGVIPDDWGVSSFDDISSLIGDGIHTTPNYDENGDFYFVNGNNLVNGSISLDGNTKKTNLTEYKKHKKPLDQRTLLLSINGTIGNVAEYNNESIVLGKSAAFINVKKGAEKKYIFYVLGSHRTKLSFFDGLTGSTIKNLGLGTIRTTLLPLPPEKEQIAIANALSDVDALISELEKLIAKKQAIKTATMQQLLTGRTRLPQFALRQDGTPKATKPSELGDIPEDWEVYRFEQNFTIYAGGDVPKDSFSRIKTDTYPYPIFANAIQGRGLYGYTSHKRSKPDSVTITARGYLGHAEYRNEPFFPIVRLLVMEPVGTVDSRFATYAINELVEFPTESTGVPQLTAPQVGKFSISAPADVNEQTAIATVLSDMDAEIQTLEQRLGKTRQIKQGMMQELLTGKTRLIKPSKEVIHE